MAAQTPEQCDALYATYLNSGNLEGLIALYEPSAIWVQQRDADARGTAAIRKLLAAFVAIRPVYTSKVTKLIHAGENLTLLYTDWSVTASGTTLSGRGLQIVRRQPDGTWRFAIDDPFGRVA